MIHRASSVSKGAPIPVPTTWSRSAVVVVVGYGGAGGRFGRHGL